MYQVIKQHKTTNKNISIKKSENELVEYLKELIESGVYRLIVIVNLSIYKNGDNCVEK